MPDRAKQGNETGGESRDGPERRGGGPRALASPLDAVTRRALGRRGFAEAGLITAWETVVGVELAAACRPDRLSFPHGRRDGGTLRICVAGGIATELQHLEPALLERINGHFGYRAVARLTLVHMPPRKNSLRRRQARHTQTAASTDNASSAIVEAAVAHVSDPDIRAALTRLGRALVAAGGKADKQ